MKITVEELTKQIEEQEKLKEQWSIEYAERYAFEGPPHREIKRLKAAIALIKLGAEITGIYNGFAYIETPKGKVMQYALITGKFKLTTDSFWLPKVNKKAFVEKFLNRE
jgi:hypothetical protein